MIDREVQNRWILGEDVPGVKFRMQQIVRVRSGVHRGIVGELISLSAINPEPVFDLETDDGGDIFVGQSEIEPKAD
jgi:hypothetical protein